MQAQAPGIAELYGAVFVEHDRVRFEALVSDMLLLHVAEGEDRAGQYRPNLNLFEFLGLPPSLGNLIIERTLRVLPQRVHLVPGATVILGLSFGDEIFKLDDVLMPV